MSSTHTETAHARRIDRRKAERAQAREILRQQGKQMSEVRHLDQAKARAIIEKANKPSETAAPAAEKAEG